MYFKQTQQMDGDVKWQVGARTMEDHGPKRGNWRVVLLKCDCTVRLIQDPTMKDNPPVVMWSAHDVVVTKVMFQISEGVMFLL